MRQRIMLAFVLLACTATQATAGGWEDFWHRFYIDMHRNNCWPEPFVHADRYAARAPFALMAHNGWRMQNTIVEAMFHPETNRLTHAGALKIRWIVTQNPAQRRTVYVLRGTTQESTEQRIDAVQRSIAGVLPTGPLPAVVITNKIPLSGSGAYFDEVNRRRQQTIPSPRLPEGGGSLTGGGSN